MAMVSYFYFHKNYTNAARFKLYYFGCSQGWRACCICCLHDHDFLSLRSRLEFRGIRGWQIWEIHSKKKQNISTTTILILLYYNQEKWMRLNTEFQVQCGMRGHLGPACNAVGYVDRQIWGINHLYTQPVWSRLRVPSHPSSISVIEEEQVLSFVILGYVCRPALLVLRILVPSVKTRLLGVVLRSNQKACWGLSFSFPLSERKPAMKMLNSYRNELFCSSISAIVTGTIGIHYGHVLIHFKVRTIFVKIGSRFFGYESHIMKSGSCSKAQTLGINGSSATDHSLCSSFHRWYILIH